uniref:Class I SAM-dependent methyltransferase n=1 Tax=Globodera pallida TaxID=36090 RepID=A0A183BUB2_GLOPA
MASAAETDKGARIHNYTGVYYRYFGPIRHKALKFLEIGLFKGSSVKMWEQYFPNAELHFVDITDQYLEYRSTRSKYHFLDQSNMTQLREFTAENGGPFDIIIDDGGHMPYQIIPSFQALFPVLSENGGIYVMEDLHSAYWYGFGGTGILASSGKNNSNDVPLLNVTTSAHETPGSAIHFLKNLLDEVNFVGANTAYGSASFVTPELRQNMSEYAQHIESMHFYNSLCFIMKK